MFSSNTIQFSTIIMTMINKIKIYNLRCKHSMHQKISNLTKRKIRFNNNIILFIIGGILRV